MSPVEIPPHYHHHHHPGKYVPSKQHDTPPCVITSELLKLLEQQHQELEWVRVEDDEGLGDAGIQDNLLQLYKILGKTFFWKIT